MTAKPNWYRSSIGRQRLKEFSLRSDARGLAHMFWHLVLLFVTGLTCLTLFNSGYWLGLPFALFAHGMVFSFLGWTGAGHELHHQTVFETRWLNAFFLRFIALLLWNNHVLFSRSHNHHHLHTLESDNDGEADPNAKVSAQAWFFAATINFPTFYRQLHAHVLNAVGDIRGYWAVRLFPEDDIEGRNRMTRWSRFVLAAHFSSMIVFALSGHWELIVIVNFGSYFGNVIPYLLASIQHYGMKADARDFRENSRTVILGPLLEFLYWYMNYHVEHHMYPQIPFFRLGRLRKEIETDLPIAARGLVQAVITTYDLNPQADAQPAG